jgi:hypothetical protein
MQGFLGTYSNTDTNRTTYRIFLVILTEKGVKINVFPPKQKQKTIRQIDLFCGRYLMESRKEIPMFRNLRFSL